jgi:hypothetical protein
MEVRISLSAHKCKELAILLETADKKSPEYRKFLLELDKKSGEITFVVGSSEVMSRLIVGEGSFDQTMNDKEYFSHNADLLLNVLSSPATSLNIRLSSDKTGRVEMTFPSLPKLRKGYCKGIEDVHLQYLNETDDASVKRYDKDTLLGLVQLVDEQCRPFEFILLNSEEGGDSVKVQRDGEVFSEKLDTNTHLDFKLCLDKKTIGTIENVCESSTEKEIGIHLGQGEVIFILKDRVTSVSIPGYSDFLSKIESKKEIVISFILNGYKLKEELGGYVKMHDIKQQEQSYLLFHKGKLVVCAKSEDQACANILDLIDATSNANDLLLMVNLHLFKEFKVKDSAKYHKLKASITKSHDGEYCFSFYSSSDPHHAFFSVPCIVAPSHVSEIKALYKELIKQLEAQKKKVEVSNEQFDLVGYDELLGV